MTRIHSAAHWPSGAFILLVLTLGCADSNLGRVTGTVTIDEQPLANALVIFKPESGARYAAGRTDEQGRYELIYARDLKGAVLGDNIVEISTFDEIMGEDTTQIIPETVPARYNVRTKLTAKVERGANVIDFQLESGGEIIQPES